MWTRTQCLTILAGLLASCGRTGLAPDPGLDGASVDDRGLASTDASGAGGGMGGATSFPDAPADAVDAGDAEHCSPGQRILLAYVVNARDMGGVPLPDSSSVACRTLYRGAPLAGLDPVACAAFSELGVRTVIDLRTAAERTGKPDSPCVLVSASLVLAPLPIPYNVSPTDYLADLDTTDSIAAAFAALGDDAAYPVYFHCTWGRDRTGVLAAVILLALGATREHILAEYQLSVAGGVGAYPNSLSAVLDRIDADGGVERYLAQAGVSQSQVDVLRRHAIAR